MEVLVRHYNSVAYTIVIGYETFSKKYDQAKFKQVQFFH